VAPCGTKLRAADEALRGFIEFPGMAPIPTAFTTNEATHKTITEWIAANSERAVWVPISGAA
jgi:hypothetical protein